MKNKTVLMIVAVVIVVLILIAAYIFLSQREAVKVDYGPAATPPPPPPAESALPVDDTTTTIEAELRGINEGDLNQEFESIDRELNNL